MNLRTKGIIFFVLFFVVMLILFFIVTYKNEKQSHLDQKDRLALTSNIEFKGKVINSKVYDFGGRNYYLICVKLDSSNMKDLYIFNDVCAIKIKNNIATMCAGALNNGIVDRVEVNINRSGKIKFYYKNGEEEEFEFGLANSGVSEKDMNLCN